MVYDELGDHPCMLCDHLHATVSPSCTCAVSDTDYSALQGMVDAMRDKLEGGMHDATSHTATAAVLAAQ